MATLSATRFNPLIRTPDERLRAGGKSPNVARCATARTLLQLAFAVVAMQRPGDPAYRAASSLRVDATLEVTSTCPAYHTGCALFTPPWYSRFRL